MQNAGSQATDRRAEASALSPSSGTRRSDKPLLSEAGVRWGSRKPAWPLGRGPCPVEREPGRGATPTPLPVHSLPTNQITQSLPSVTADSCDVFRCFSVLLCTYFFVARLFS